ncbi:MAG TPA: lanthionine synthetase LanC family protein, partial [Acidobacteriota bacterium]|nr:lanthionine synthetase LanC family protein [Acidobacteriota bacterium]
MANPPDPMAYARGAGQWILSVAKDRDGALTWPVNDTDRKQPAFDLYSGMPGGILLLAELGKEDPAGPFRQAVPAAVAGLESLRIADAWAIRKGNQIQVPSGLYTGIAGIGWLYLELFRVTGEPLYRDKAQLIASQLVARQTLLEGSSLWDDSNDIISGAAGTGLFLIRASEELKEPRYLALATRAGSFLVSQAISTPTGQKWKVSESDPKSYPNFAHGTAGVAYFLLRLYEATKDQAFTNQGFFYAALGGIQELETIAEVEQKKNTCAWYHHEGDGENLWYAGWCHGPAGTARVFCEVYKVNKLSRWTKWIDCSANWLIASGIPDPPKQVDGYWNEGICCGSAGIGDFYLDLYRSTRKKEYLQAAEKMAAHLAKAATPSEKGYRWIQAENRTMPDRKDAQTGYAQGAAGIGLFFLKLSRAQRG